MKCNNCGYDNDENARFCQGCGSALAFYQNQYQNLLEKRMLRLLKDALFIVICILYSISITFSLINGNFPIVSILRLIFVWLVFSQSRRGIIAVTYMRYISGTIFVSYIIKWILCCLVILYGGFVAILLFSMNANDVWNMFDSKIELFMGDHLGIFDSITTLNLLLLSSILIICALVGILLNLLGMRSIHRFVQSVYKNLEYGQMHLRKYNAAQNWMVVFGIINAVYATFDFIGSNIASFLENGCLSATYIVSSILIKKYLRDFK